MKGPMFLSACCTAVLLAAVPAQATPYKFLITGSQTIKFVLDSSPTPAYVEAGQFFLINGATGTIDNVVGTFDLGFGAPNYSFNFGFLNASVGSTFVSTGLSLYTGTESIPTFKLGTFSLAPGYSLTISSAVPEPAGWAMLLPGFGALGLAARRRRNKTVRVAYSG